MSTVVITPVHTPFARLPFAHCSPALLSSCLLLFCVAFCRVKAPLIIQEGTEKNQALYKNQT